MAEATGIFHDLISTVPDDPTLQGAVNPTEWNKSHVLRGGNTGDLIVKDTTQASGFTWSSVASAIGGRLTSVQISTGNYTGGNPSPAVAPITITLTKASTLFIIIQATLVDANPAISNGFLNFIENGFTITSYTLLAEGETWTLISVLQKNPGTYTYSGGFVVGTAPMTAGLGITILTFN